MARLVNTVRNFAKHLRTGGVLVIEPWFTKSNWNTGTVHVVSAVKSDNLKVVRVDYSGIRGNLSVIDERTLVAKKGEGISYYTERQFLGLFERAEFLRSMAKAGLQAKYIKRSLAPGRGLYIGTQGTAWP